MSRSRYLLIFILGLALALAGAGQLARKEPATPRALYEGKCAKCHRLYDPGDYSEEEWRLWTTNMVHKTKLRPDQEKLLTPYLQALRPGKP
jgi:hypothetical protein